MYVSEDVASMKAKDRLTSECCSRELCTLPLFGECAVVREEFLSAFLCVSPEQGRADRESKTEETHCTVWERKSNSILTSGGVSNGDLQDKHSPAREEEETWENREQQKQPVIQAKA